MSDLELSRRERQIMRVIYRMRHATVQEVKDELDDAPSLNAVRTLIQILESKGHLKRKKEGREFVYSPTKNPISAGVAELQGVLDTFFQDSISEALASHLTRRGDKISDGEIDRLADLIQNAREVSDKKA
jgi:BlaI family penicillinase repressor